MSYKIIKSRIRDSKGVGRLWNWMGKETVPFSLHFQQHFARYTFFRWCITYLVQNIPVITGVVLGFFPSCSSAGISFWSSFYQEQHMPTTLIFSRCFASSSYFLYHTHNEAENYAKWVMLKAALALHQRCSIFSSTCSKKLKWRVGYGSYIDDNTHHNTHRNARLVYWARPGDLLPARIGLSTGKKRSKCKRNCCLCCIIILIEKKESYQGQSCAQGLKCKVNLRIDIIHSVVVNKQSF